VWLTTGSSSGSDRIAGQRGPVADHWAFASRWHRYASGSDTLHRPCLRFTVSHEPVQQEAHGAILRKRTSFRRIPSQPLADAPEADRVPTTVSDGLLALGGDSTHQAWLVLDSAAWSTWTAVLSAGLDENAALASVCLSSGERVRVPSGGAGEPCECADASLISAWCSTLCYRDRHTGTLVARADQPVWRRLSRTHSAVGGLHEGGSSAAVCGFDFDI
jgi:hypothetical protein